MAFSLERFESYAYSRDREMGMRELVALLTDLDNNYGHLGANFRAQPLRAVQQEDIDQHVWTRTAAAASSLLADDDLSSVVANLVCGQSVSKCRSYYAGA